MKKLSLFVVSSALCSMALVGCGGGSDNPSSTDPTDTSNQTSMPVDSDNNNGGQVSSALDGTWRFDCQADGDDEFEKGTMTIAGGTATSVVSIYTDSDCSVPAEFANGRAVQSLEFPGGSVQTSLGTATFVNVTLESTEVNGAPLTAEEIAVLQELGVYDTEYDLFLITAEGRLYFGDFIGDLDGTTPARRPTDVDPEYFLVRQ